MIALLIRHGHADAVGVWLAGRRSGIALSAEGRQQARGLGEALKWMPISAVYSSPLERAVHTASPVAEARNLAVQCRDALTDMDFGDWTGRSLADLADDKEWQRFNTDRQHARAPRGEAIAAVQRRVVDELLAMSVSHAGETVAIVTHAEPIRCAIAAFGGRTLDDMMTVEISPAHVSTIAVSPHLRRVLGVNVPAQQHVRV